MAKAKKSRLTGDDLTAEERLLEEEAEYWERHMDDEPGEEVKSRVAKDVKTIFYFRAEAEELDEIADAAEAAGKDMDVFIREAALKEARRRRPSKSAVEDVRKKAKQLADAVERL